MTSYTLRTLSLCMAWMPVTALAQTATTFQLSLVPAQRTIVQGGWQNIAVEIARIRGFASPISLRIVGTPAGVTASFGQNPVTTRSTRLTLKVAATVAPGTYNLSVIGDAGTSVSAPFQLTVAGPLPPPSVSVDSTLRPALTSLAGPDPANPRTIACLADAKTQTDFVLNELLLSTNDSTRLSAFLTKWHGTLVTTLGTGATAVPNVPPLKLVRIDPAAANNCGFAGAHAEGEPQRHGRSPVLQRRRDAAVRCSRRGGG